MAAAKQICASTVTVRAAVAPGENVAVNVALPATWPLTQFAVSLQVPFALAFHVPSAAQATVQGPATRTARQAILTVKRERSSMGCPPAQIAAYLKLSKMLPPEVRKICS